MNKPLLISVVVASALASACGPNQRIINSAEESQANSSTGRASNVAPATSSFERDLNAMRNAEFNFIYVFRRRDGSVLDADDKGFVTRTSPPEMNRRTLADEGKALIIGSNFRMPADRLEAFKQRFVFEDHSPAGSQGSDGSNQNR